MSTENRKIWAKYPLIVTIPTVHTADHTKQKKKKGYNYTLNIL